MSESTMNAIVTAIGSLLGGIIGAYATIQAAKEKLSKNPNDTDSKFPLLGIVIGTVIGAVATLVILAFLGFIPPSAPESTSTVAPIAQETIESWTLGKLIYEEDFEDETINGIRTMWGTFDIVQTADGNHVWQSARSSAGYIVLPTTSNDYAFESKIMQVSGQEGFAEMQIRSVESAKPCPTNYAVYFDIGADWITLIESGVDGTTCTGLRETGLYADYPIPLSNGVWYTLRIEGKGAEVRVYLNGNLVARDKDIDGTIIQSNTILLGTCCYDYESFVFTYDDIKVWLLDP